MERIHYTSNMASMPIQLIQGSCWQHQRQPMLRSWAGQKILGALWEFKGQPDVDDTPDFLHEHRWKDSNDGPKLGRIVSLYTQTEQKPRRYSLQQRQLERAVATTADMSLDEKLWPQIQAPVVSFPSISTDGRAYLHWGLTPAIWLTARARF